MTKRIKWSLIGVIILFIAGIIVFPKVKDLIFPSEIEENVVPDSGKSFRNQVLSVNAKILSYQSLTDKLITIGSTLPDEEVDLSFETSGKIVAIYFTEGTHVKKGDLLAKINDRPLQAELKKLEAQIPLAKDRVYRQRTLLEKDAVSQEAYEQVQTELEKLMADIDLVKANIDQTELRAPFDGIIGLRKVSEGAYITSSSSVVANLTKISPLKVEFSVPEKYASEMKEGNLVVFKMEKNGVQQEFKAKVYATESKIAADTRSLTVRALYPNTREEFLPGRYASVEVTRHEIENALAIPSESVIPEMGKDIVYLYKGGVAEPREITIGLRTEDQVQALQGLQLGDTLLVSGVMQLRTGMKVKIDNLEE